MDLNAIINDVIGAAAVGVALFAAINASRAVRQSTANGVVAQTLTVKTTEIAQSINGRLSLLIQSIHAKAESDAAAATSAALLRESQAYNAGKEDALKAEPLATAAAIAELRVVAVATADAVKAALPSTATSQEHPP